MFDELQLTADPDDDTPGTWSFVGAASHACRAGSVRVQVVWLRSVARNT